VGVQNMNQQGADSPREVIGGQVCWCMSKKKEECETPLFDYQMQCCNKYF
jgi:hypothetical protein